MSHDEYANMTQEEALKKMLKRIQQDEYANMSQEEALKLIVEEYPEYTRNAIQIIKDDRDLVKFLSMLDSF